MDKDVSQKSVSKEIESQNSDAQLFGILTQESEEGPSVKEEPPQESIHEEHNEATSEQPFIEPQEEQKEERKSQRETTAEGRQRMRQSESSPEIPITLHNLPPHIRARFEKFTIYRDQEQSSSNQTSLPNRQDEEVKQPPREQRLQQFNTPVITRPPRHPTSGQRLTGNFSPLLNSGLLAQAQQSGGHYPAGSGGPFIFHRLSNSSPLEDRGRQARVPLQKLTPLKSVIRKLDFETQPRPFGSSGSKSANWDHLNSGQLPR